MITRIAQLFIIAASICIGCSKANASSIQINSACQVGSCSSADTLALGTTQSSPFNFTYTFANSDRYLLQGNLTVFNLSAGFGEQVSDFVLTYEGNDTNSTSRNDVLVADFLQNIAVRSTYRTTAYESIGGVFGPGLGNASTASGQAFSAGQALALLGPYTPPPAEFSGYSTGSITLPAGAPLIDYRYTLAFGAGSQVGSFIGVNPTTSPVSEPGTLLLVGSGALGILRALRRKLPFLS